MPTESEYGDDVRMLDDLTRLKLRLIDKKLKPHASARHYNHRREYTPDYYPPTPPHPLERRDRFHRRIDRRNNLLQKLWEELGDGESSYPRRYGLPLLTPRDRSRTAYLPWMEEDLWNKTGNTKKDLMELMLIQNSQMQQWMMTQTLQKQQAGEGASHNHYYAPGPGGRPLPPIQRNDAGSQYPQDFFQERVITPRNRQEKPQQSPPRRKNRKRR